MEFSELTNTDLSSIWGDSKAEIEAEIKRFGRIERDLQQVVKNAGFKDLKHFLRAKRNLVARLKGQRPISYRRRSPEDEERILQMSIAGQRTKDIAAQLGLAPNTVSNVKKVLKDQGKLT